MSRAQRWLNRLFVAVLLTLPTSAFAVGSATPPDVKRDLSKVFEDEGYSFCHDESDGLFPLDQEYCELVGETSDVCPALPKVCKNKLDPGALKNLPRGRLRFAREGKDYGPKSSQEPKDYADYSQDRGSRSSGSSEGDGKSGEPGAGKDGKSGRSGSGSSGNKSENKDPKDKDSKDAKDKDSEPEKTPESPPEPEVVEVPGWVAVLFRILFYAIVAIVLGLIIYYIAKNLIKGREEESDEPEGAPKEPTEEAPIVPRGPIETDVDRLLARARALAAEGKYEPAIEAAYAALLRRLEGDGIIDLHPSRTNGDYVRSIRDRSDLKTLLREIANDVESVQFGDSEASPSAFDSVYRRVLPLVGRASAVLAVLFSSAYLSSCDALPADAPSERATLAVGQPHIGGSAPSGLSALVRLLEKNDKTVSVRRPPARDEKLLEEGVIVILPGTPIDDATWTRLYAWVEQGGALVLAGYRSELQSDRVGFSPATSNAPIRPADLSPLYLDTSLRLSLPYLGSLSIPQSLPDPKRPYYTPPPGPVQPILTRTDGSVYAAVIEKGAHYPKGKIYAFADDRLFANIALTLGDNAAFLVAFFRAQPSSSIEIWDEPQGKLGGDGTILPGEEPAPGEGAGGADNPLDSLAKAHLLPIILQLLALVLLYLLYRGSRFGKPREPKEASRRAYADHSRALGLIYARANASRHATSIYSVWALDRLRERFLKGGRKGLTPLAESIAASTGRPIGEVMNVLVEATGARDEVAPPSSYRGAEMGQAGHAPPRRTFWVMEELERYLSTTKGNPKRGRGSR